jgi:hypothetical protein
MRERMNRIRYHAQVPGQSRIGYSGGRRTCLRGGPADRHTGGDTAMQTRTMRYRFQRAHFRILYPIQGRPRLILPAEAEPDEHAETEPEAVEFEVIDCSERGVRFRPQTAPPAVGTEISGRVRFRSGAEVAVEGVVIRIQAGEVAVHLDRRPIPLGVIYDEQRFLRARFPLWVEERMQLLF